MKLLAMFWVLALTGVVFGAVPKPVMKEMLSYSHAKFDSNQNIEMMMRAKESTWQEVRDRLVEINTQNMDFWVKQCRHYSAMGFNAPHDEERNAEEQMKSFAEGIFMLKKFHPGWTKKEQVAANLKAIGYVLELQSSIINGS